MASEEAKGIKEGDGVNLEGQTREVVSVADNGPCTILGLR